MPSGGAPPSAAYPDQTALPATAAPITQVAAAFARRSGWWRSRIHSAVSRTAPPTVSSTQVAGRTECRLAASPAITATTAAPPSRVGASGRCASDTQPASTSSPLSTKATRYGPPAGIARPCQTRTVGVHTKLSTTSTRAAHQTARSRIRTRRLNGSPHTSSSPNRPIATSGSGRPPWVAGSSWARWPPIPDGPSGCTGDSGCAPCAARTATNSTGEASSTPAVAMVTARPVVRTRCRNGRAVANSRRARSSPATRVARAAV
nr:hypothetical protein [Streptomyces sp. 1331.2]